MAAIIISSPDAGDIMEALSLYYFPDGSTKYTEMFVKLIRRDKEGNEIAKVISPDKFVIQFTGEQNPVRPDVLEMDLVADEEEDEGEGDDA